MEISTVEKKRAEAQLHRGVTYDARIDKFTAEITLAGDRVYLGAFVTAVEAGRVYEEQRRRLPISRRPAGGVTFAAAYRNFLTDCSKDEHGAPAAGEIFTAPDGQRFRLAGVEYARKNGKVYVWSRWEARCRVCGQLYDQSLERGIKNVKWMMRNCEQHRGDTSTEATIWSDPEHWSKPVAVEQKRDQQKADNKTPRQKMREDWCAEFIANGGDPAIAEKKYLEKLAADAGPNLKFEYFQEKYLADGGDAEKVDDAYMDWLCTEEGVKWKPSAADDLI